MRISKTDVAQGNNSRVPQGNYRVCCTKAEFIKSNSKGNPMTDLLCEIIEPESVVVDGVEQNMAGRTFHIYLVHTVDIQKGQNQSQQSQVYDLMEKLKLTDMMEKDDNGSPVWDSDHTEDYFKGIEFDIALDSSERVKRFAPNRAAGEKVGKPMIDGEGNEIKEGWEIKAFSNQVLPHCNPTRNERIAEPAI